MKKAKKNVKWLLPSLAGAILLAGCEKPDPLRVCLEGAKTGGDHIEKACKQAAVTSADAAAILGELYFNQQNYSEARLYLEDAADKNNGKALYYLGQFAELGLENREPNAQIALNYYQRACQAGSNKACERQFVLSDEQAQAEQLEAQAIEQASQREKALADNEAQREALAQAREKAEILAQMRAQREAELAETENGNEADQNADFSQTDDAQNDSETTDTSPTQSEFAYVGSFSDGLAAVKNQAGRWGFITKSGKFAIEPQFFTVSKFSDGLAAACLEGVGNRCTSGFGYINGKGEWQIEPQYDNVYAFKNGKAKVVRGGRSFIIDRHGRELD